jgi:hypothetical protein
MKFYNLNPFSYNNIKFGYLYKQIHWPDFNIIIYKSKKLLIKYMQIKLDYLLCFIQTIPT